MIELSIRQSTVGELLFKAVISLIDVYIGRANNANRRY